jgi:uncharacterized membrane protein
MSMKGRARILYKLGMFLVVMGFCLAVTQGSPVERYPNGFFIASIYFKTNQLLLGLSTWLTFISAVVGLTAAFFCKKMICDLLCLTLSIVSGLHFYANLDIMKSNTLFSASPAIGLYFMLIGWGLSFIGFLVLAVRKTVFVTDR